MALASAMNMAGLDAAKPVSGFIAGRIYFATDTLKLYYDNGSGLTQYAFGASAITLAVSTKSSAYTVASTDDVILADATSAAFTVALPTAIGWTKRITIKKIDSGANAVTVGTTGGQTIDGQSTRLLNTQFSSVTLISDNANWRVTEIDPPLTSKGDLLVGTAANALNRLGVGTDTQVLTADSTQATGVKWAAGSTALTNSSAFLSADVTMTTANTFYDGPSLSLAAGTWVVIGGLIFLNSSAGGNYTIKIWDGTTATSALETTNAAAGFNISVTIMAVVTPGSTTTYKVSAAAQSTGAVMAASPNVNNTGLTNKGGWLYAVKIG